MTVGELIHKLAELNNPSAEVTMDEASGHCALIAHVDDLGQVIVMEFDCGQ